MANANFTPDIGPYTQLKPFRFWCQKVLPLVYDDSLSYYELLGKVVDYLNKTMEDVDTQITDIQGLLSAYEALQGWVNHYYDSADFEADIDAGLDRMAADGRLDALIEPVITDQLPALVNTLLPGEVENQLPGEVASQIGLYVEDQLPGVVSNQIGGTVQTQLPGVVSNQIPGTVANQLPAVVSNQIGPVVEDKIVDPVEDWLNANVSGGIAVDRTLAILGAGADAAFTGARLETLDNTLGYEHVADTGFIITTANPFAFNYEYINDSDIFSDQGTHTYKMIVVPVNTGDKYCINAHKISVPETENHFAVTYAFCAKYVGDPDTDTPFYLPTIYSRNNAENLIATVPEITIPTGLGYDETTGYLVVITANIEDPIYKVVDEGLRKDVSDLKSELNEVSERKSTGNIFDPSYLVSSAGWTKDREDYYGTAKQAADAFGTSPYYPVSCDPSKRYVLSFKAMTPNAGSYSGVGLVIAFVYGDGATNQIGLPNSTNEYTRFTLVSSDSTTQHGGITAIKFGYSSGGNNIWHMKEITLNEGTTPIDYYGEITAVDKDAREGLSVLQDDFSVLQDDFAEKTSNIRMPVINFQFDDGVAKDADIVSIFDDYDFKCGFAVPTNIVDLSPYVTYQGKGYEVISHSTDGTGMNDASVDSSVIEAKLKTSKETLENAGLKIRGFVTPNSIMNLKFRPLLRKYYDWADTISFGAYSGTINDMLQPYMMPVDGVYNGWRVSLQTTTLANAKLAVDRCIENYGCLTFYGHAWALDTDNNLTTANLTSLLDYIADKVDAGECTCDIPSKAILNYFNVRNDDVSDKWINVSSTDAELDSRLSVVGWDMRYNPKTKIFAFSARLTATEEISGSFILCKIPVHLVTNVFGTLITNESGKNMLFYNNGVLCQTSTWASGTSYRMTGFGIFDYVL